jgi:hypothetical protein
VRVAASRATSRRAPRWHQRPDGSESVVVDGTSYFRDIAKARALDVIPPPSPPQADTDASDCLTRFKTAAGAEPCPRGDETTACPTALALDDGSILFTS